MLDFVKKILEKVSFDPQLFEKELKKGIGRLIKPEEVLHLQKWCSKQFYPRYSGIINNCFA